MSAASPSPMLQDAAALRRAMVDCQLRTYDVTDKAVLAAMDSVAREDFVPPQLSALAYLDKGIRVDNGGAEPRFLLPPMVLARMIQTLAVKPGERVLDYACATGYSSAVLRDMGAEVVGVEPDATLAERARSAGLTVAADVASAGKDFDAVLVNGACELQPEALFALLKDNGRLVCVMGEGRAARVMLYQRSQDHVAGRQVFDAAAPRLAAFARPAGFVF